jgi:FAD/FMN-containing dehydrogenase
MPRIARTELLKRLRAKVARGEPIIGGGAGTGLSAKCEEAGGIDLIVLQNKRLRRIALREDEPTWVRIPPGVPHGAINRGTAPAIVVNAVLRHRPSDERDYQSRPVPAALAAAWAQLYGDLG